MAGAIIRAVLLAGFALFAFFKLNFEVWGYSWEIAVGILLIATLVILYKIFVWRKNDLVITDQRIILNARQGLFSRTVTELLYRDIHDISFKQAGLPALIYRYGRLIIKMPSGNEIIFDKVPSSAEIVKTINEVRAGIFPNQNSSIPQNSEQN